MTNNAAKDHFLSYLPNNKAPLSLEEINQLLPQEVAKRTLRRWLAKAVEKNQVIRVGQKRSTRYLLNSAVVDSTAVHSINKALDFAFLKGFDAPRKTAILKQLRDLWTHSSTALEGNTLSLGDTHFVLEEGLTISGKPIKDHQEVLGHASALNIIYRSLNEPVNTELCFNLHKAIQTEIVLDIDKPYGAWKNRPNGTYTVSANDKPIYLEYALPQHVDTLMKQVINEINHAAFIELTIEKAPIVYAKIHAALAHIHPFWDGNGRFARLLANIPLLKSGLPPIVISQDRRRDYIQLLATYELTVGQLDNKTGVWPDLKRLKDFEKFCLECYQETKDIIGI